MGVTDISIAHLLKLECFEVQREKAWIDLESVELETLVVWRCTSSTKHILEELYLLALSCRCSLSTLIDGFATVMTRFSWHFSYI